ncbi:hypothetical protein FN924_04755 [Radiobacillus deserti]|uniref:HTH luxR-type domain-containing protein n=1 Tax=Radiobacillus deserti TaxID=2594883 RepID=A0A516KDU9_9BACI|nr:LuxR C-terminal-related transcriptional regulator [Radiobacillus deserti]QDP39547.1 hypothetical protein FN924_04755 [Radiobacillus deserti]
MGKELKNVQSLQDAFAKMLNVACLISDSDGFQITEISGSTKFLQHLINTFDLRQERLRILNHLGMITSPVFYDYEPGIKGIIAPVRIKGENKFFVWTTFVVESGTKELIHNFFRENDSENYQNLIGAIDELPEVSNLEKEEMLRHVGVLCESVSHSFLANYPEKNLHLFSGIHESLQHLTTEESSLETILKRIIDSDDLIDFVGVAEKTEEDFYTITYFHGPDHSTLLNRGFSTGEGFLGQVIATGNGMVWENVVKDPRVSFYTSNHVKPLSIFGYPLSNQEKTFGVFFGGSISSKIPQQDFDLYGRMVANIITIQLQKSLMERTMDQQLLKISTFNDILHLMISTNDLKKILFILVDISVNLTNNSVSCIILKPVHGEKQATVISRGMTSNYIQKLGGIIAENYFDNQDQMKLSSMTVTQESTEQPILLIPITFRGDVLGCLAIGMAGVEKFDEVKQFLTNLCTAAGVLLSMNHTFISKENKIIQTLELSMSQLNGQIYEEVKEEQKLLRAFGERKRYTKKELEMLVQAGVLKVYDEDVLQLLLPGHSSLLLIKEYKDLVSKGEKTPKDGEIAYSEEAQLLYMISSYMKGKKQINQILSLPFVDREIKQDFHRLVTKDELVEGVIELPSSQSDGNKNLFEQIHKHFKISNREKEVLKLVVEGFNNREIAERLYISDHTVKNHISSIFQKLNVTDRAQAIAKVYQSIN